jgi:hypothetical protein
MRMSEPPRPDGYWTTARVVGIVYLTFCSAFGGGVFLFTHPRAVFVQIGFGAAAATGLIVALIAGIPDPAARPIRWGLLWLALGFVVGTGVSFGLAYLFLLATGF